jgi:SAM-dependent methyltransferase
VAATGVNNTQPTSQRWSADRYVRNARFVSDLGAPLLALLAPQPGESILDLGCGEGALSQQIVESGARVVAVDAAPDMAAAARARGLDARVMDGEALSFDAEFDALFSNAALHWMRRPNAVIAGMHRALKPGGRMVAEFGGGDNVATVIAALIDGLNARGIDGQSFSPWYFPDDVEYRGRLEAQGFIVDDIALIDRPTPLPGPLGDWLDTFCESFLFALPKSDHALLKAEVAEAVRPRLCDDQGRWSVDYVRLRVVAHLPAEKLEMK